MKVWNLVSGECELTFHGEGEISAYKVSPDNQTSVAGEASGRVHFLRLEGGQESLTPALKQTIAIIGATVDNLQ